MELFEMFLSFFTKLFILWNSAHERNGHELKMVESRLCSPRAVIGKTAIETNGNIQIDLSSYMRWSPHCLLAFILLKILISLKSVIKEILHLTILKWHFGIFVSLLLGYNKFTNILVTPKHLVQDISSCLSCALAAKKCLFMYSSVFLSIHLFRSRYICLSVWQVRLYSNMST